MCYGRTDVPAQPEATLAAARQLAQALPRGLALQASPLQRCEQLASILRGLRPDLTYGTDPRLAEMDFGAWEGLPWDAVPVAELDAWTRDFAAFRPGGGESVRGFMARVAAAWDEAAQSGQERAWITHAGVIRAATLLAAGRRTVHRAGDWPSAEVPFGDWRVLEAAPPIPNG